MPKPRSFSVSDWIDLLLGWLKWPVAVVSLALLPAAATAMLGLFARVAAQPRPMLTFMAGFVTYLVLWWKVFGRSRFSLFLTLEQLNEGTDDARADSRLGTAAK